MKKFTVHITHRSGVSHQYLITCLINCTQLVVTRGEFKTVYRVGDLTPEADVNLFNEQPNYEIICT